MGRNCLPKIFCSDQKRGKEGDKHKKKGKKRAAWLGGTKRPFLVGRGGGRKGRRGKRTVNTRLRKGMTVVGEGLVVRKRKKKKKGGESIFARPKEKGRKGGNRIREGGVGALPVVGKKKKGGGGGRVSPVFRGKKNGSRAKGPVGSEEREKKKGKTTKGT